MMNNNQVQSIAKQTIDYIVSRIYPGQSLIEIRKRCESKMLALGADSFWYYNIGAFVFSGEETAISVSGRKYQTADRTIRSNDIVTIDLSPSCGRVWGDYARTIILENGQVVKDINQIQNDEWRNGLLLEKELHTALFSFIHASTTFEDVYFYMNERIEKSGYVNLDFNGNLGHTINRHMFQRSYIEKGNKKKISKAKCFTFEPHISIPGSNYGFKREDIYSFKNGQLLKI